MQRAALSGNGGPPGASAAQRSGRKRGTVFPADPKRRARAAFLRPGDRKQPVRPEKIVCLQIVYIQPLTLRGRGGKLLLALREREC